MEEEWQQCDRRYASGGPLSPVLSNILLDKLDKELEGRDTVRAVCGRYLCVRKEQTRAERY